MTTEEAASVFLGDVDSIKGLIAAVEIFKSIGLLFNNAARTRPAMVVKGTGRFRHRLGVPAPPENSRLIDASGP